MTDLAVSARPRAGLLSRLKTLMGLGPWTGSPGPLTGPVAYTDSGWMSLNWPMNFGQIAYDPVTGGYNSVVYSCISLYARTIAELPGYHLRELDDGGTEVIKTSALSRILKRPNDYQTRSDFLLNMVFSLLGEGNAYALALRNDRFEVAELHQFPSRQCRAYVAETGDIFYAIGGNPIMDRRNAADFLASAKWVVPARDILHLKGPTPRDPLVGESPLCAAWGPVLLNQGGSSFYAKFYENMSRPSGVLQTDLVLTKAQVDELRERWNEQSKGINLGGTPILTAGLKWAQAKLDANEAQIAESMKMSTADIARLFGIPLALVNGEANGAAGATEQLIMMWQRTGLGFYIDQVELAYDKLFGIERSPEFTAFDMDALLRPDFKSRMEGLARAVQGGIYAPNEARRVEGLKRAKDGDEPRVQQQVVPLSAWSQTPPKTPAPGAPDAPPPAGSSDATDGEDGEDAKAVASIQFAGGDLRQQINVFVKPSPPFDVKTPSLPPALTPEPAAPFPAKLIANGGMKALLKHEIELRKVSKRERISA